MLGSLSFRGCRSDVGASVACGTRRKETSRNWSNLFLPKKAATRGRRAENKQDSNGRPQSALHCCRLNVAELPLCVMAVSLIEIAGRVDTRCDTVIWMAHSRVLLLASFRKWCESSAIVDECKRERLDLSAVISANFTALDVVSTPASLSIAFFQEDSLTCTTQTVPKRALNWDELRGYLETPSSVCNQISGCSSAQIEV